MRVKFSELKEKTDLPYLFGEDHYANRYVKYYDNDVSFENLDLDADHHENCSIIIVNGNLTVEKNIINVNGDGGLALVVLGDVSAKMLIAGGSEIDIHGTAHINEFVFAFYNHGFLSIKKLITNLCISEDHYTEIHDTTSTTYYLDTHEEDNDELLEALLIDDVLEKEIDDGEVFVSLDEDALFEHITQGKPFRK